MIRLCSRFDSVLFTPKISEIPSYGNYSRSPEGIRHRQQAHGDPDRTGQRQQGPLRDAFAASARAVARLVQRGTPTGVAVSRNEPGQPDDGAPAQARLRYRG